MSIEETRSDIAEIQKKMTEREKPKGIHLFSKRENDAVNEALSTIEKITDNKKAMEDIQAIQLNMGGKWWFPNEKGKKQ